MLRRLVGGIALGVAVPAMFGCGPGGAAETADRDSAPTVAPTAPTAAGEDAKAVGKRFVQGVLDALTAGDGAGVAAAMCVDSADRTDAPALAGQRSRLRLDPTEIVATRGFVGADLLGTVDGRQIDAGRIAAFNEEDGWCVEQPLCAVSRPRHEPQPAGGTDQLRRP